MLTLFLILLFAAHIDATNYLLAKQYVQFKFDSSYFKCTESTQIIWKLQDFEISCEKYNENCTFISSEKNVSARFIYEQNQGQCKSTFYIHNVTSDKFEGLLSLTTFEQQTHDKKEMIVDCLVHFYEMLDLDCITEFNKSGLYIKCSTTKYYNIFERTMRVKYVTEETEINRHNPCLNKIAFIDNLNRSKPECFQFIESRKLGVGVHDFASTITQNYL
ncbi:uncharacterized protein LOC131944116 [Physella acuta]|uniref:uncharacterized protein LOC131944116 n=1 Tax=Physella acuta TaxID=109671 RepID=UPI0027DBB782|nr:uncharacterized protein LOC131944116 [Physella acuta]